MTLLAQRYSFHLLDPILTKKSIPFSITVGYFFIKRVLPQHRNPSFCERIYIPFYARCRHLYPSFGISTATFAYWRYNSRSAFANYQILDRIMPSEIHDISLPSRLTMKSELIHFRWGFTFAFCFQIRYNERTIVHDYTTIAIYSFFVLRLVSNDSVTSLHTRLTIDRN